MNWNRWIAGLALSAMMLTALHLPAQAVDYGFTTAAPQDYYKSSSYEDVYGSQYNYGGRNVIDYQIPELEYGLMSTTQTGVMERTILPGLQGAVATSDGTGGSYGISGGGPITVLTEAGAGSGGTEAFLPATSIYPSTASQRTAYTSVEGMKRSDGSIGTVQILVPLPLTPKIIVTLTVLVPVGGFGLIGISDDSLTRWLGCWWRWRRRRRIITYRGECVKK